MSVRDDWLHRGPQLHDMDLDTYVCVVERVEKPLRGVRLESIRKQYGQVFPFERHYKLAGTYMQVLRKKTDRVTRYVGPNCLRESVNGGEENAAYKAFHCSLMRCAGPGHCAEPQMCSSVLFPNAAGVYVFKASWRAREAEILTMAARGRAKKALARKLEVLADTTLCKVCKVEPAERAKDEDEKAQRARVLREKDIQIEVQRFFQQGLHRLRDGCEKTYPHDCAFVCIERAMEVIWSFAGVPSLWHAEQLHLAEWLAMRQLEWLFNLSLSVDAKSTALEQVAKHKKSSSYEAEHSYEPHDERIDDLCYAEVQDVGGMASDDDAPVHDEDVKAAGALAAPVSQATLLRILDRDDEVALAQQPGQGRREGAQNMRAVHDAFRGAVQGVRREVTNRRTSKYSSSELLGLLEAHEQHLKNVHEQENQESGGAGQADVKLVRQFAQNDHPSVRQMTDEEVAGWFKAQQERSPLEVAKELCEAAGLNRDQKRPVALLAKKLQAAWLKERQRREQASAQERDALRMQANYLPLKGRLVRMLVYGGGGCGKTLLVNRVISKLLQQYYGPRGCIRTAFSNKAARLIKGKTGHAICKLRGGQSLTTPHLRVKSEQEQRNLAIIWAPAGAGIQDEFSQNSGPMAHAQTLRGTYGRANAHGLVPEQYAEPQSNWGSLPVWLQFGDHLQYPPIPASGSLLSDPNEQSREHRVAVQMFADQDYVCCLRTAMRFRNDPALERILTKMRTPGEDRSSFKLTAEEWRLLQSTDLAKGATLHGTELWHHAGYAWTVVCMAQWLRSQLSAAHHRETLFLIPAHDHIQNVSADDLEQVRDELLRVPSMNSTARLPAVAMLHKGMHVRFTQTVSPVLAAVDATGTVESIELHEEDRRRLGADGARQDAQSFCLLRHMPTVLVKVDDCEEDMGFGPGVVAVTARISLPFAVDVTLKDSDNEPARTLSVKARREQLCLVVSNASTLYTLQGTTCDLGLIYHWRFPARLDAQMRWLTVYMVLSRVPTLGQLRSIGLDGRVRDIIDKGPPTGMLTRFNELFGDKALATDKLAEEAMQELGW